MGVASGDSLSGCIVRVALSAVLFVASLVACGREGSRDLDGPGPSRVGGVVVGALDVVSSGGIRREVRLTGVVLSTRAVRGIVVQFHPASAPVRVTVEGRIAEVMACPSAGGFGDLARTAEGCQEIGIASTVGIHLRQANGSTHVGLEFVWSRKGAGPADIRLEYIAVDDSLAIEFA